MHLARGTGVKSLSGVIVNSAFFYSFIFFEAGASLYYATRARRHKAAWRGLGMGSSLN